MNKEYPYSFLEAHKLLLDGVVIEAIDNDDERTIFRMDEDGNLLSHYFVVGEDYINADFDKTEFRFNKLREMEFKKYIIADRYIFNLNETMVEIENLLSSDFENRKTLVNRLNKINKLLKDKKEY